MKQSALYTMAFAAGAAALGAFFVWNSSAPPSGGVSTSGAPPARLTILKQPGPRHLAGKAIPFQVGVVDAQGKLVTGPNQPAVTISLGAVTTATTLHGTTVLRPVDGLVDLTAGVTKLSSRDGLTDGANPIHAAALADLNGDDKDDLVLVEGGRLTVGLANGDGTFVMKASENVGLGGTPTDVKLGDVDGDGIRDVIVTVKDPPFFQVFLGIEDKKNAPHGSGAFAAQPPIAITQGGAATALPVALALADLNEDGVFDLVVCDGANGALVCFMNNGTGTFTQRGVVKVGANPTQVLVKDLDGDSNVELVCGDAEGVAIIRSAGVTRVDAGGAVTSIALGDEDLDGKADVFALLGASGSVRVVRNASQPGTLAFEPKAVVAVPSGARRLGAADVDNDGHVDLTLVGDDGVVHLLMGDGAGGFAATTGALSAGASRVLVADLNGDHALDLISCGQAAKVWINEGPKSIVNVAPSVRVAGRGYTFTASAEGLEAVTTSRFDVEADPSTDPLELEARRAPGGGGLVVDARLTDLHGNTIPSDRDRVYLSVNGREVGALTTRDGRARFEVAVSPGGRCVLVGRVPAKDLTRSLRIGSR